MFDRQLDMFKDLAPTLTPLTATTFPADTGLGEDNMAPRSFTRLSDESIAVLAELFIAFEKHGDWPELLDLVLIVLLPKGEGGHRPIGLFPTPIRIRFRARLIIVKVSEKQNELPSVYGGPGMGA